MDDIIKVSMRYYIKIEKIERPSTDDHTRSETASIQFVDRIIPF